MAYLILIIVIGTAVASLYYRMQSRKISDPESKKRLIRMSNWLAVPLILLVIFLVYVIVWLHGQRWDW